MKGRHVTKVRLTSSPATEVRADALVLCAQLPATGDSSAPIARGGSSIPAAEAAALVEAATALRPRLRPGDAVVMPSTATVAGTVAVAFARDDTGESWRQAVGAAVRALPDRGSVVVAPPDDDPATVAAVAEGARLGAYTFDRYRGAPDNRGTLNTLTVATGAARQSSVKKAVTRASVVIDAVLAARDLVNTPPSDLTPQDMAVAVRRQAADTSVRIEVLDERRLARGGYGGLIAVGQGSAHPPRLVRMTYRPSRAKTHLVLVGKGITFDSGGLSLKPPSGMITMKCDMGGAAAVAEATLAIARLDLPVRVTAYLALAENMPSGTAQRPGDVITIHGGTTVEVLNTDAEGRLVMADALVRAGKDSPDLLVDVATLTGAQTVALGHEIGAVMGNDDAARTQMLNAADAAGESLWPMPLPPGLRASLDSKIADLANVGERMGGMLTAGLFLAEFVPDGVPWVHVDIAGPAFNDGPARDYTPPGGTGVMVRTLVALAEDLANA